MLLCTGPSLSDPSRILNIEVFPPEAEIRAFFPTSPPAGDLLPNHEEVIIPGTFLKLNIRISSPGFETKEDEVSLVAVRAVRPGYWKYETTLRPGGLSSFVRLQWHSNRTAVGVVVGAFLTLLLAIAWTFRSRIKLAEKEAKLAKLAAVAEVADLRERLEKGQTQLEGATLDGYTIVKELGEGAYSTVFQARNNEWGELVALKLLKYSEDEGEILARMRREIAIGRELNHPNIVKMFAFGTLRKAPYIVTEFIPGRALDTVLKSERLSLSQTVSISAQLFAGLAYAHKKGVIHRDLKPANLFLTDQGQVKILDFGMARMLESEVKITRTGQALGTPLYMSPEQVRAKSGPESDFYAAGVILFEMLTGRTPFPSGPTMEVLSGHAFKKPPKVIEIDATIPLELSDLVDDLLIKKPESRLVDVGVILQVLEAYQ